MELPRPAVAGLRTRFGRLLTVRSRLMALALVGVATTTAVSVLAVHGQTQVRQTTATLQTYNRIQLANRDTEVRRGNLRNALLVAVLQDDGQVTTEPLAGQQEIQPAMQQLLADLDQVAANSAGTSLAGPALALRIEQEAYARVVAALLEQRLPGSRVDAAAVSRTDVKYDALVQDQQAFTARVDAVRTVSLAARGRSEDRTRRWLQLTTVVAAVLLVGLSLLIRLSILRTLRRLRDVAMAIAAGDFAARCGQAGTDEIAELGAAVDDMAASLTTMVDRLEDEAQRDGFGRRLADAFDMADDEPATYAVVGRALAGIIPGAPVELLLADSSEAHLKPVLSAPDGAGPGCQVESPFHCVAVRRSRPSMFADSSALDACPKLQGRPQGAVSATCTPVTFMGRALGVLHSTAPVGSQPGPVELDQLGVLAGQAGARIGTLRATSATQLQASTDGLTGLLNRRTLEDRVRDLVAHGRAFAVVMADLDHFKQLNDRFGHESGDRALRVFAQTLQANTRAQDLVCRYGGEEFVLVLPDQTREQARESMERLRVALSGALSAGTSPAFTASWGITDSVGSRDLRVLLGAADEALFTAKHSGRDRVVLAGQGAGEDLRAMGATP